MDTQREHILLQEADRMLQSAQDEMMRAAEDAIAHTVCFNARQAIINYLTAFLLENGVRPKEPSTMASLLAQCRTIDGRFELVSLDNIHCRFDAAHQDYCLSVDQVGECLRIANQTRDIVKATTPGY